MVGGEVVVLFRCFLFSSYSLGAFITLRVVVGCFLCFFVVCCLVVFTMLLFLVCWFAVLLLWLDGRYVVLQGYSIMVRQAVNLQKRNQRFFP